MVIFVPEKNIFFTVQSTFQECVFENCELVAINIKLMVFSECLSEYTIPESHYFFGKRNHRQKGNKKTRRMKGRK
jgi:hypothetical protein